MSNFHEPAMHILLDTNATLFKFLMLVIMGQSH